MSTSLQPRERLARTDLADSSVHPAFSLPHLRWCAFWHDSSVNQPTNLSSASSREPVFGDPSYFCPTRCPTLSGLINGNLEQTLLFQKCVSGFERFLRKLQASETEAWQPPRVCLPVNTSFSMVGRKREREAPKEEVFLPDRSRVCYNLTRVFVAAATEGNPLRVKLYWYSKPLYPREDDVVVTVYAGQAPPFRAPCSFPYDKFRQAARTAMLSPGSEAVCSEVYVCALLHPRHTLAAAKQRFACLEERLREECEICEVNPSWEDGAVNSMLSSMCRDVWETAHCFLD